MWYRWMLTLLLASAILGRTFHCLYVDTQLPGMAVQSRTAELPPLQSPNDFDPNESCCLCKGAVIPPLLTADAAGLTSALASPLAVVAAGNPVVVPSSRIGRAYDQYLLGPPPLGGRAVRADPPAVDLNPPP